jgi:hypothetical protein
MDGNKDTPASNSYVLPLVRPEGSVVIDDTMTSSSTSNLSRATLLDEPTDTSSLADIVVGLQSWKMGQAYLDNDSDGAVGTESGTDDISSERSSRSLGSDLEDMDFLLPASGGDDEENGQAVDTITSIKHAPLIDASVISSDSGRLLPQYGLLGWHMEATDAQSKLLLNTNVPFSIFVCGVQGNGKSHTTSCILENSLIPSRYLGKLRNPLSALVFSFAPFGGDGVGFTVSEAAFLAAPDHRLPGGAHVKRVHVLVSPSNFVRISKIYTRLPNVFVTPFRLKSRDLDIDTMLTLMNVSESDEPPLYMAQVTQILREMSTAGGPFNYKAFKMCLKKKDFNPTQKNMLQMRLDLLESFLDMNSDTVEPYFRPGEITIMDMSCPFVDANTACIIFRIGLKQYRQSKSKGKMIVLDEAHKVCRLSMSQDFLLTYSRIVHAQRTGRKGLERNPPRDYSYGAALWRPCHHFISGTYTLDGPHRALLGHRNSPVL